MKTGYPFPPAGPSRPELRKYQAGYFLIALSAVLLVVGGVFVQLYLIIIGIIVLGTGIVFQFDRHRPRSK